MSSHNQITAKSNPIRTRQLALIVFIIVVLITVLALIMKPQRIRPGQVVDKIGTYRFPTGNRTVKIARDAFDNLLITVRHRVTRFYFISYTHSDKPITFESKRDWFVSVDQYDRLWVYHGHWDRAWGKQRQMPSGGTVPYAPAVLMHGAWFLVSGVIVSGHSVVTETGNWAGVPQEFFNRIPDRDSAQWGNVKTIPKSATQFTKQQQIQITTRLQRNR